MRPEIEQAVRFIQRKDPKSVEEALQLLQNTVFSFSMKVCGQRQDAEDTMQIEEAIRLSEEKYCSVGAMLKQAAKLETTYEIVAEAFECPPKLVMAVQD